MSFDPAGRTPTTGAPEDDSVVFDGLERAVAQARTKIADHDNEPDVDFLSPIASFKERDQDESAAAPFDSSAVMDVLRGAIDRYTNGDGHQQGTWVQELAQAKDNQPLAAESRHLAAGYAPDRRRLAAIVVVVFLLVGGLGYSQFGTGSTQNVKTNTVPTVQGQPVTTAALPPTTPPPPPTEAPTTAAPVIAPPKTTTTVRRTTTTTAPPETTTEPPTTDTTTTTAPTTTTTKPCPTPPSGSTTIPPCP